MWNFNLIACVCSTVYTKCILYAMQLYNCNMSPSLPIYLWLLNNVTRNWASIFVDVVAATLIHIHIIVYKYKYIWFRTSGGYRFFSFDAIVHFWIIQSNVNKNTEWRKMGLSNADETQTIWWSVGAANIHKLIVLLLIVVVVVWVSLNRKTHFWVLNWKLLSSGSFKFDYIVSAWIF